MTPYSFARSAASPLPERVEVGDYPTDAAAIADARAALIVWGVTLDDRPLSIAVARGADDSAAWLGAWDLESHAPVWTDAPG